MDEEELERLAAQAERDAESMGLTPEEAILASPLDFDTGTEVLESVDSAQGAEDQSSSPFLPLLPSTGAMGDPEAGTGIFGTGRGRRSDRQAEELPVPEATEADAPEPAPDTASEDMSPVSIGDAGQGSFLERIARHAAYGAGVGGTFGPENLERVLAVAGAEDPESTIEEFRSGAGPDPFHATLPTSILPFVDSDIEVDGSELLGEIVGGSAAMRAAAGLATTAAPVAAPLVAALLASEGGRRVMNMLSSAGRGVRRVGDAAARIPGSDRVIEYARPGVVPQSVRGWMARSAARAPGAALREAREFAPFLPITAVGFSPYEHGEGLAPSMEGLTEEGIPAALSALGFSAMGAPFVESAGTGFRGLQARRQRAIARAEEDLAEQVFQTTGPASVDTPTGPPENVTRAQRERGSSILEDLREMEGAPERLGGMRAEEFQNLMARRAAAQREVAQSVPTDSPQLDSSPTYNRSLVELFGPTAAENLREIGRNVLGEGVGSAEQRLIQTDARITGPLRRAIEEAGDSLPGGTRLQIERAIAEGDRSRGIAERIASALDDQAAGLERQLDDAYANIPDEIVDLDQEILRPTGTNNSEALDLLAGQAGEGISPGGTTSGPINSPREALERIIGLIRNRRGGNLGTDLEDFQRAREAAFRDVDVGGDVRRIRVADDPVRPPSTTIGWQAGELPDLARQIRGVIDQMALLPPNQAGARFAQKAYEVSDAVGNLLDRVSGTSTREIRQDLLLASRSAQHLRQGVDRRASARQTDQVTGTVPLTEFDNALVNVLAVRQSAMLPESAVPALRRATFAEEDLAGVQRQAATRLTGHGQDISGSLGPGDPDAQFKRLGRTILGRLARPPATTLQRDLLNLRAPEANVEALANRRVLRGPYTIDQVGSRITSAAEALLEPPRVIDAPILRDYPILGSRSDRLRALAIAAQGAQERPQITVPRLSLDTPDPYLESLRESDSGLIPLMGDAYEEIPLLRVRGATVDAADNYRNNMTTGGANQE